MKAALVFPGQGSQAVGMGQALARDFPVARETFDEAAAALGFDLPALCWNGPAERLELTAYTQPAVLTASLAAFRVLEQATGLEPLLAAGHSLGEYSALAAAGALSLREAALLVHRRGQWMQEASPAGEGAMAAVLGLALEAVAEVCREAAAGQVVVPANDNAPGQIVISGHAEAVDRAAARAREYGGKTRQLKVSGPFHTALMAPAAAKMKTLLGGMPFAPLRFSVIANVDAEPYGGPETMAERLTLQLVSPVRWRESVLAMARLGAELFLEVGPGTALAGLVARILPGARVLPMNDGKHIAAIERALA